jgi:hypothetical protein
VIARRVAVLAAVTVLLGVAGCGAAPRPAGPARAGFSVDHPPQGARPALLAFTRCMRQHGVRMPEPAVWGHGRLIVYYPRHDPGTKAAYRACYHFRSRAAAPASGYFVCGNCCCSSGFRTHSAQRSASVSRSAGGIDVRTPAPHRDDEPLIAQCGDRLAGCATGHAKLLLKRIPTPVETPCCVSLD